MPRWDKNVGDSRGEGENAGDWSENVGDSTGTGAASPPREVAEPLIELNRACLELLSKQARARSVHAVVPRVAEMWDALDRPARARAISYPYLLFDAGFADPQRWRQLDGSRVADRRDEAYNAFFTVDDAVAVTQWVLVYAWSLARHHAVHARLALGMHPQSAKRIAAHTVLQAHQLAGRHWVWLRPRWPQNLEIWEELLTGAAEGGAVHTRARMHGVQLLTADTASAMQAREGKP